MIWLSISRDLIASYLRKCATRDSFATHAIAPSVHIVFVDMSLNVIILSSTLITTEQKVKFPWKYFFSKYKKSAVYLSRKCSCLCCIVYRKNYLLNVIKSSISAISNNSMYSCSGTVLFWAFFIHFSKECSYPTCCTHTHTHYYQSQGLLNHY